MNKTTWRMLKAVHRTMPWTDRVLCWGRTLVRDLIQPPLYPPGHFYSPIPSRKEVADDAARIFDSNDPLLGIDLRKSAQSELLERLKPLCLDLPFTDEPGGSTRYFYQNDAYPHGDAILLAGMIRLLRPGRIVEIGSGYSSCVMLDINEHYFNNAIRLTFVDPYPQRLEMQLRSTDASKFDLIQTRIQTTDFSLFEQLAPRDIVFVDSSHVCKTGSDLHHILFQILPRLVPGVHVHFHDIYFPFEYPGKQVLRGLAWNEVYLLRAFLCYNKAFRINLFTTYAGREFEAWFHANLPLCLKSLGAALWLERVE
jgi:predicted O-methyltransferase YrrM